MKRAFLIGLGFAAVSGLQAVAADIPYKAPMAPALVAAYNWTGIYVGVNGGFGWGKVTWLYTGFGTTADHKTSGGLFGGTLGAQMQTGQWVFGLEGDFDWANIKGSTPCPNPTFSCNSNLRTFGTVRGRVGYSPASSPNWLLYVTGGAAFGDQRIETVFLPGGPIPTSGTPTNGSNNFGLGWTFGGGVEWAFPTMSRWSVKLEYLHYNLGTHTYTVDNLLQVSARHSGDIIRAGINYRFGYDTVVARY